VETKIFFFFVFFKIHELFIISNNLNKLQVCVLSR
jgi:hypothetical protein